MDDMRSGRARQARGSARVVLALGAAALLVGTGCTIHDRGVIRAEAHRGQSQVDRLTDKAEVAIAEHRGDKAVRYAEAAVALAPTDPRYRALLARAYLQAGRFQSAAQAAGDALTLNPTDNRAALDLALAQTALGNWTAARATLTRHAELLRPADRGLALALAGDPLGGAVLIGEEARGAAGTAKARQNLALALALAGRWGEARAVAAVDLAPGDVDRRIQQWMRFARPTTSSEQVATLLGTRAVADPGQPVALALAIPPVAAAPVAVAEAPVPPATPAAEPIELASAAGVRFAPRQEIVQPIGSAVGARQVATRAAEPAPAASGQYYVQLGAHADGTSARKAWAMAQQRHRALAGLVPFSAEARVRGGSYQRLSVGGFARPDALALCARLRSEGGSCFVREQAGDRVAQWADSRRQVAAR